MVLTQGSATWVSMAWTNSSMLRALPICWYCASPRMFSVFTSWSVYAFVAVQKASGGRMSIGPHCEE